KFNKQGYSKEKVHVQLPESNKPDYRAVSIKAGKTACHKVRQLSDQVFLCKEAPFVPLDLCDCRNQCKCRYIHLDDRRQSPRRSADSGLPTGYVENERRARVDRRKPQLFF